MPIPSALARHRPTSPDPSTPTAFSHIRLSPYCYVPHRNRPYAALTTNTSNDDTTIMTTRRPTTSLRLPLLSSQHPHPQLTLLPALPSHLLLLNTPAAFRYLTSTSIHCIYPNPSRTAHIRTVLRLFISFSRSNTVLPLHTSHILRLALHYSATKLQPVPTCHSPYSPTHLFPIFAHASIALGLYLCLCLPGSPLPLCLRVYSLHMGPRS